MSNAVIQIENLSKAYRLGMHVDRNQTFRDALMDLFKAPLRRLRQMSEATANGDDTFWALKNVNLEVNHGEVIGIIGRNGAGKSTLLKVLSRITEPTEGQARLRGRVASLLEVGTGFHPELTGRENIYLNGAILGMKKTEIDRKFDAIVQFAEVEKFLDTQVKRYSSGMYVRLAFAVAAHLDPEILIVDEVLAVGDAAFQKKCLGKMGDVVKQGRTILFVSHNMDAVLSLCTHAVLLKNGQASERLTPEEGVKRYLAGTSESAQVALHERTREQHRPRAPIFHNLNIATDLGNQNVLLSGGSITFEIDLKNYEDIGSGTVAIALHNARNQRVIFFHSMYHSALAVTGAKEGRVTCTIPSLPLVPGTYYVELVMASGFKVVERVERAAQIEVVFSDLLGTGKVPNSNQGYFVLPCTWDYEGQRAAVEV